MSTDVTPPNSIAVDYDPFADSAPSLAKSVISTPAQQEIWSTIAMEPHASCAFNESINLEFKGPIKLDGLESALRSCIERHDALRGTFSSDGQSLNISTDSQFELNTESLGDAQTLKHILKEEAETAFDLVEGPLFRIRLVCLNDQHHVLVFTAHHIVCDGWTLGIIVQDLSHFYRSACGEALPQLEPAYSFVEYASDLEDGDDAFWLAQFEKQLPEYELPTDLKRPKLRTFNAKRLDLEVDLALFARARQAATNMQCSISALTMAVYMVALSKWSQERLICVGMPIAAQASIAPDSLAGHCVSTAPIMLDVNPEHTVADFAQALADQIVESYEHRNFTFGQLLQQLNIKRDASKIPLLPTLFNFDVGIDASKLNFGEAEVQFHSNPRSFENFEIFINLADYGERCILECQYNTDLFSEQNIQERMQDYLWLFEQMINAPDRDIRDLSLVREQDFSSLLPQGQGSIEHWPNYAQSLAHTLSDQAQRSADKTALIFGDHTRSFTELEQQSDQWANWLHSQGVGVADRVGVCLERGPELLAALIGIWKVGACYIPLDPDFPDDRLAYMIGDAGLQHLITQERLQARLPRVPTTICLETMGEALVEAPAFDWRAQSIPDQTPAYSIYTSGSTGKPKGVVVPQKAVINFLNSMAQAPGLTEHDRLLAVTTLSFDIAVLELYLPLWVGATVVLASKAEAGDGRRLLSMMQTHQVTCMQATPATWRMLLSAGWQDQPIKALCGGEALPSDLAGQLIEQSSELWNMYGPTETTVWSTCAKIEDAAQPIHLGPAIANTQLYVLDQQQRPCPTGIAGELYIGGDGVTLGYHQRDELNAKHFIANPFGQGTIYRTGDKVRYLHDGALQYLGRLDQQVKVRGFRIELGEIETLMREHEAIDDCALAVREIRAGDARLVAYVVWQGAPLTLTDIRNFLRAKLPPYMIPQHLEGLAELPRTLNNKLDRKALQLISIQSVQTQRAEPPQTEAEKIIAGIWTEVTENKSINRQDNFFDIGGHSLLSMQVILLLEERYRYTLQARDLLLENLSQLAKGLAPLLSPEMSQETAKANAVESAKEASTEVSATQKDEPTTPAKDPATRKTGFGASLIRKLTGKARS